MLIRVELISDVICPWCYLGKRRLSKAMAAAAVQFPGLRFEVRWSPYFLNPRMKRSMPKRKAYGKKLGEGGVAKMEEQMRSLFAEEGVVYTLEGDMGPTADAHRLMEFAYENGGSALQDTLAEILFRCYFTDARDISRRDVLLAAGAEAGIDRLSAGAFLESGAKSAAEIAREIQAARQSHPMLSGVPHYVLEAVDEATGEVRTATRHCNAFCVENAVGAWYGVLAPLTSAALGCGRTRQVKAGFEVPGAQDTAVFLKVLCKLQAKVWDSAGELLSDSGGGGGSSRL